MKKLFFIFGIMVLFSSFVVPVPAQAHELLPKGVVEYVQENPDASAAEIEAFFAAEYSELYEGYNSDTDLLSAAKNPDASFFDTARDFATIGFTHILGGWDHILFVLALLLVFASFKEVLVLVTTFTVAHSITLVLAATEIFVVPGSIVEPIIALSIAYMALATVFLKNDRFKLGTRGKVITIFLFGLIHGLGFSGLLRDINIDPSNFFGALISFNVGIELGQIVIVAVILPILYLLRKTTWHQLVIQITAITISLIALAWFLERIG